ncbi:MAG: hypothetical protein PIR02_08780 [Microbacterium enclense]
MTINEKAPGAAPTATEGIDQNRTDHGKNQTGPIMTDSATEHQPAPTSTAAQARAARAKAAARGTIAADPRIVIEDAPTPVSETRAATVQDAEVVSLRNARLAEDELAHLPVFIVKGTGGRHAKVWRSTDGKWWRRGGAVRIQRWPEQDGPRAFVVYLHEGANRGDLDMLLGAVERARSGKGLADEWERIEQPWADELTFKLTFSSWSYVDPYTHRDPSPRVYPCNEPLCLRKWHEDGVTHVLDEVRVKLPDMRGQYSVSVTRCLDEDTWIVDVFTDEFFGTADDAAEFASHLQWMTAECRKANAARAEKVAAA